MRIQFYDNLEGGARSREEVRLNELGLYVHEDGRRVAIGFNLTPFLERPSIMVRVTNAAGIEAASLSVIDAIEPNFNLTIHLRDGERADPYQVEAFVYYVSDGGERQICDRKVKTFNSSQPGDQ